MHDRVSDLISISTPAEIQEEPFSSFVVHLWSMFGYFTMLKPGWFRIVVDTNAEAVAGKQQAVPEGRTTE